MERGEFEKVDLRQFLELFNCKIKKLIVSVSLL